MLFRGYSVLVDWLMLPVVVVAVLSATSAKAADSAQTIRDIGTRRQLFVDDYLIASMENLKRSFHSAEKHGPPVIVPEHPWEGVGTAPWPSVYLFGDVIWDEEDKIYRMWYTSATKDMTHLSERSRIVRPPVCGLKGSALQVRFFLHCPRNNFPILSQFV